MSLSLALYSYYHIYVGFVRIELGKPRFNSVRLYRQSVPDHKLDFFTSLLPLQAFVFCQRSKISTNRTSLNSFSWMTFWANPYKFS